MKINSITFFFILITMISFGNLVQAKTKCHAPVDSYSNGWALSSEYDLNIYYFVYKYKGESCDDELELTNEIVCMNYIEGGPSQMDCGVGLSVRNKKYFTRDGRHIVEFGLQGRCSGNRSRMIPFNWSSPIHCRAEVKRNHGPEVDVTPPDENIKRNIGPEVDETPPSE